jgi:hypothetical protein
MFEWFVEQYSDVDVSLGIPRWNLVLRHTEDPTAAADFKMGKRRY